MFDIAKIATKVRLHYHANMVSIVNAANQLHILTDEKAEELNKNHCMVIFTDIIPRLYGKKALLDLLEDKDEA